MRVKINKRHQKLLLLQRIDLISEKQRTIRKKFGRFLFTNFFVNFFNSQKEIENKINDEFLKESIGEIPWKEAMKTARIWHIRTALLKKYQNQGATQRFR